MVVIIALGALAFLILLISLPRSTATPNDAPAALGATPEPPHAGFWCIPQDEFFFLKLKIQQTYSTPSGECSAYSSVEAPTWAIIANIELLCRHYPWLREKLLQVTSHYGIDVFHRTETPAYPLQIFLKALLEQHWTYVLDNGNGQALFCAASPPSYGLAVKKELLGELVHRPANVKLPGISEIVCVTPEGERGEPVLLQDWKI